MWFDRQIARGEDARVVCGRPSSSLPLHFYDDVIFYCDALHWCCIKSQQKQTCHKPITNLFVHYIFPFELLFQRLGIIVIWNEQCIVTRKMFKLKIQGNCLFRNDVYIYLMRIGELPVQAFPYFWHKAPQKPYVEPALNIVRSWYYDYDCFCSSKMCLEKHLRQCFI